MAKKEYDFNLYLSSIDPQYTDDLTDLHELLIENDYSMKIQEAKQGFVVSYADPNTKKATVNFVSRKVGPMIRIYADHSNKYNNFLETLPEDLVASIAKSSDCKRLLNPEKCSSKCSMGYLLSINGETYKKCRYGCFFFAINSKNTPYVKAILENEIKERSA